MTSLYLKVLKTLYSDSFKLKFLLMSGLLKDYLESVNIISKFEELYDLRAVDLMINKLPKLDVIRVFVIRYLTAYLSYKGESLSASSGLASAVNTYISTVLTELTNAIDFYILKARGDKAQFLAMQKVLLYLGELLEFYKNVLIKDPEDALDFIRLKYEQLEYLVTKQASIARKVKELNESLEELSLGELEETISEKTDQKSKPTSKIDEMIKSKAKQPHEALSLAKKTKQKYTETLIRNEELKSISSPMALFTKQEVNLLYTLIRRKAICPRMASAESVAESLSITQDKLLKLVRQVNAKVQDRFGTILIDVDDSQPTVMICLHRLSMDSIKVDLAKYHPNLVRLYEDTILHLDRK